MQNSFFIFKLCIKLYKKGLGLQQAVSGSLFLRVARVGGNPNNGANCGLFYWNLNNASSNSNWNCGARVIIFGNIIKIIIAYLFPCPLAKIKSKTG